MATNELRTDSSTTLKKSKPQIRRCLWCNRKFKAKRAWHKYDKNKCKKAAFDARRNEIIRRAQELVRVS